MSTYFKLGALIHGLSTTITSGGNTALTASSRQVQQFTGTQPQTVTLPDATTLKVSRRFDISNRSTQDVTVNNFGGGQVAIVPAGSQRYFLVTDIGTSNGAWQVAGVASGGGGSAGVDANDKLTLLGALAGIYSDSDTMASRLLKYNPEEVGGDYFLSRAPISSQRGYADGFVLGGYGFSVGGYNGSPLAVVERYNNESNAWLSRQNLPVALFHVTCFELDGYGHSVGGNDPSTVASNYKYNIDTNTWSTVQAIAVATGEMAGLNIDNYGYVISGNTGGSATTTVQMYDGQANAWRSRTSVPLGRLSYGHALLNNRAYVFGGYNVGYQSNAYRYNQSANSWETIPSLATAKAYGSSGEINGEIVFIGGNTGSIHAGVQHFSDVLPVWVARTPISNALAGNGHTMLNLGGSGYTYGGDNSGYFTTVQEYRNYTLLNLGVLKSSKELPTSILAATLTNALVTKLPIQIRTDGNEWKRFVSGEAPLKTGEVLSTKFQQAGRGTVQGGVGNSGQVATSESYNVIQNLWTAKTSLSQARYAGGGFNVLGKGYAVAGYNIAGATATALNQEIDELLNTQTSRAVLPASRTVCPGFSLSDFGHIVGGEIGAPGAGGSPQNTNYRFNPTTNSWTTAATLLSSRGYMGAFVLNDKAYIIGGNYFTSAINTVDRYDYATDSWLNRANMGTVRHEPGALSINDFGFAVGGYDTGGSVTSCEKYNPSTNTWGSAATLNTQRGRCRSWIDGGYGHVAGGEIGAYTDTTEQLNDAQNSWTNKSNMSEAKSFMLPSVPGPYRRYEVRVGIPASYPDAGGGVWATRANMQLAQNPHMVFAIGDTVYGGYGNANVGGTGRVNWLQSFKPVLNVWYQETSGNLSAADTGGACSTCALYDRGFVNGHNDNGSLDGGTQVYDSVLKAWTTLASGGGSGQGNQNFVLNGFAYSASGGPGVPAHQTATYRYNLSTNSWSSSIATLNAVHYGGGAAIINGFAHDAGGANTTHERLDDAANTWTTRQALPNTWQIGGSVVIKDGWHIAAPYQGGTSNVHSVYRPDFNVFTSSTNYPISAYTPGAAGTENDAHFYGGYNGSYITNTYSWMSAIKNAVLGLAVEIK